MRFEGTDPPVAERTACEDRRPRLQRQRILSLHHGQARSQAGGHQVRGRPAQAAVHRQVEPARGLSLRPPLRAEVGRGSHPVHQRYHRQARDRLLHPEGPRHVGHLLRARHHGGRRHQGRHRARLLRLRPLHGRPGPARRLAQAWQHDAACLLRQHGPSDPVP